MSNSDEIAKKCCIWYVNGHDLLTNNNTDPSRRKVLTRGFSACKDREPFIPIDISDVCFKYYHDDYLENIKVNTLDLGYKRILRNKLVYEDTMYGDLLQEWSAETGIPPDHLMVYNYTERTNKTMRPNVRIEVDRNEKFKGDGQWSEEQIKRHLIPTNPNMKRVKSIHDRIGNVWRNRRAFLLLDDREIKTLGEPKCRDCTILVALKYFDILEQKMYFVDWLKLKNANSISFGDISEYIESSLIPNALDKALRLHSLHALNAKISEFDQKTVVPTQSKFRFYEESAAYFDQNDPSASFLKARAFDINDSLHDDYYNGDIFVFQINPFHPYFCSLKPFKIDHLQYIGLDDDQQHQELPMHFKCRKHEYEERGVFWYCDADEFLKSLIDMTDIEIRVRGNTGWDHWSRALIRHYLNREDDGNESTMHLKLKKTITRSWHILRVEKRTTFGMIRKILGSYYRIKPEHIEIWIPQRTNILYNPKWDFGSGGRGRWDRELSDLIKARTEWRILCPLQFEIRPYNVNDFDQMSAYNTAIKDNCPSSSNFTPRIQELALFNLIFETPQFPATVRRGHWMKVTYRKNWSAKELIQYVLDLVIENPLFLTPFFGRITDYVRKYELEDNSIAVDDVQILGNLRPSRFLIVDEDHGDKFGVSTGYYMDDKYKMPSHFSQIKYTDFKVFFLRKNDPLVLQRALQATTDDKGGDQIEAEAKQQAVDSKADAKWHQTTVALWTYITRIGDDSGKYNAVLRVVIERGESFRDVILREIWPYLVLNRFVEIRDEETDFKFITESCQFRSVSCLSNKDVLLTNELLNRPNLWYRITPDMCLIVYLPEQ